MRISRWVLGLSNSSVSSDEEWLWFYVAFPPNRNKMLGAVSLNPAEPTIAVPNQESIGFNMVRPDGTKAPGNMRALPFFEQVHAGSYDVKARVAWLDEHGISRQIMYPNTGGFSSQMFFTKIAPTMEAMAAEVRAGRPAAGVMHRRQAQRNRAREEAVAGGSPRRNDACPCGSGRKFKQCCMRRG